MKPVLFEIPGLGWPIPGYGLMLTVAFLGSILWAARRASLSRGSADVVFNCGFVALICGVVGCRAMFVWHYWDKHFAHYSDTISLIFGILDVRKGGLEFYGGFILSVIGVLVWLRLVEKVSVRWYLDIAAPSAALGLALGRIGCFLNGCCYGGVCEAPWAVRFPFGSNAMLQQWQDKLPGAELREELMSFYGDLAYPLSREVLNLNAQQLDALYAEAEPTLAELMNTRLRAASAGDDAAALKAEEKRLATTLRDVVAGARSVPGLRGCRADTTQFLPVIMNMRQHQLSGAQVLAMAREQRALPAHPTQLYSTLIALLIALLLDALYWRRTRDGQVICMLLVIEPVTRYLIEVIRADNPLDTLGFTISQGLALSMTLIGLAGLAALRFLPRRSPLARPYEPEEQQQTAARAASRPA